VLSFGGKTQVHYLQGRLFDLFRIQFLPMVKQPRISY
jgi:hypothetical protein